MRKHFVLLLALATPGFACNGDAQKSGPADAPAKKVVRGVDTKRIPVPNHGPDVMAGKVDKSVKKSAQGKFDARFHDKVRSFIHFSPGENAAIFAEETGVGRVMITAAESDHGYPRLELRLSGVRLDKLELPVTFPLNKSTTKKLKKAGALAGDDPPKLEVKYLVDGSRSWSPDPEAAKEDESTVTLTGFAGKTLRGSIKARLVPQVESMGEVIEIKDSDFEIELRLRGVEPGPEDEGTEDERQAAGDDKAGDADP